MPSLLLRFSSLSWLFVSLLPVTASAETLTGTLKKIADTNTIVIAHREGYTPFSFVDANKKPIGYSLDLCHKIIGAIKTELKLPNLQVKYVQVDPSTRISTIRDGKADLECSGTTHTLSRRKDVDFSLTVMLSATRLVAKSADLTDIKNLNGKRIAAASNTTMLKGAQQAAKEAKVEPIWVETKDHDAAFAAVANGKADVAALENLVLTAQIAKDKAPKSWHVGQSAISFEPNALMLRQNDSPFRAIVDRALARVFASGEIFPIFDRWFKPINEPMTDQFRALIRAQSIPE